MYIRALRTQVNIAAAAAQWVNLAGNPTNANSSGLFSFTDTNTTTFSPRFYRVVSP